MFQILHILGMAIYIKIIISNNIRWKTFYWVTLKNIKAIHFAFMCPMEASIWFFVKTISRHRNTRQWGINSIWQSIPLALCYLTQGWMVSIGKFILSNFILDPGANFKMTSQISNARGSRDWSHMKWDLMTKKNNYVKKQKNISDSIFINTACSIQLTEKKKKQCLNRWLNW